MKTSKIPERLVWVVESLAVEPADRLLEIGCGRGIAVSLICDRLGDGTITALDRSAVAIDAAERQCRACPFGQGDVPAGGAGGGRA